MKSGLDLLEGLLERLLESCLRPYKGGPRTAWRLFGSWLKMIKNCFREPHSKATQIAFRKNKRGAAVEFLMLERDIQVMESKQGHACKEIRPLGNVSL